MMVHQLKLANLTTTGKVFSTHDNNHVIGRNNNTMNDTGQLKLTALVIQFSTVRADPVPGMVSGEGNYSSHRCTLPHPAINGAAELLVQTFMQTLPNFSLPSTSNHSGVPGAILLYTTYSQSELPNDQQIRTKIDILFPSLTHIAQGSKPE